MGLIRENAMHTDRDLFEIPAGTACCNCAGNSPQLASSAYPNVFKPTRDVPAVLLHLYITADDLDQLAGELEEALAS